MKPKTKQKSSQKKKTAKSKAKESVKIKELETNLKILSDKHLRLSAEFDNFRKRTVREKMDLIKNAGESIFVKFLPILDDIERAISSMEKTDNAKSIKDGINLIHKNLLNFVNQNGVKPIEAVGEDFNTDLHEAVTKVPSGKKSEKGKIVDCIEKGYFLNDKVIRFSKVIIAE